jgi:hypothetical protein
VTSHKIPSFEEFVRPLVGNAETVAETTPLSELPAGHFAVLAWLDDMTARHPARVEADLIAGWDAVSLRDVYALLFADAETTGAQSS